MLPSKKSTKIMAVCSSPVKDNAEYLAEVALGAAARAGSETELVLLREQELALESLVSAHAVILASPVIEGQASQLMLDFMDKMRSTEATGLLANKKAGIIVCGEKTLRSTKAVVKALEDFCARQGMVVEKVITAIAEEPSGIREQKDTIGASMVLGRKLLGEISPHKKHG